MNHDLKLTVTETINAPVATIWNALTDKELIKKYFFGTDVESDWKKGSAIQFTGEWEGNSYLDKGTILDIEKEKLLKYDYWSSMSGLEDKPGNYATITYFLEEKNGQTELTVTQKGFRDQEAYEHSSQGWKDVLQGLKKQVEE